MLAGERGNIPDRIGHKVHRDHIMYQHVAIRRKLAPVLAANPLARGLSWIFRAHRIDSTIRGTMQCMAIVARLCERAEMNCQIIHDFIHTRQGWSREHG